MIGRSPLAFNPIFYMFPGCSSIIHSCTIFRLDCVQNLQGNMNCKLMGFFQDQVTLYCSLLLYLKEPGQTTSVLVFSVWILWYVDFLFLAENLLVHVKAGGVWFRCVGLGLVQNNPLPSSWKGLILSCPQIQSESFILRGPGRFPLIRSDRRPWYTPPAAGRECLSQTSS